MEDLRKKLEKRLKQWRKEYGEKEYKNLMDSLIIWADTCLKNPASTIWDGIKKQVEIGVKESGKSEDELLDYLFDSTNHDVWMFRLQTLDITK